MRGGGLHEKELQAADRQPWKIDSERGDGRTTPGSHSIPIKRRAAMQCVARLDGTKPGQPDGSGRWLAGRGGAARGNICIRITHAAAVVAPWPGR